MINRILHHVLELLATYWPLALLFSGMALILVVFIFVWLVRGKPLLANGSGKAIGKQARSVRSSLSRLPSDTYFCYHEIILPRLDDQGTTRIQHMVFSPYGIFVVQVQNESGTITGGVHESKWTARGKEGVWQFTNPIIRNNYHVKAAAKYLDLPEALFVSIVFFQNEVRLDSRLPLSVISEGIGRQILSHKTEIVSREVVSRSVQALAPLANSYDEAARQRKHHTRTRKPPETKTHDLV
jgi:hypothetical protein